MSEQALRSAESRFCQFRAWKNTKSEKGKPSTRRTKWMAESGWGRSTIRRSVRRGTPRAWTWHMRRWSRTSSSTPCTCSMPHVSHTTGRAKSRCPRSKYSCSSRRPRRRAVVPPAVVCEGDGNGLGVRRGGLTFRGEEAITATTGAQSARWTSNSSSVLGAENSVSERAGGLLVAAGALLGSMMFNARLNLLLESGFA